MAKKPTTETVSIEVSKVSLPFIKGCPFTIAEREEVAGRVERQELSVNSPEFKLFLAKTYENDPLAFALRFLPAHFRDEPPTFHREMVDVTDSERKCAFAAPRGHAKSTVISFALVLHKALYKKKKSIVIVSSSEDMAVRFLRRIRDELETNKALMWLFGMQKTDKWSETELKLSCGVTIHAKGRGAQLRGLIDGASRPDFILLDDIEDEELVRSELRRMDLEQWVNGTVLPTLEPSTGQVIVVGTILHESSLLARLLDKELYPDFATRRYAAIGDDDVPLWPARFTFEALKGIKDGYAARGQLTQFYLEYQNDPIPQESAAFRQGEMYFFEKLPDDKLMYCEAYCDLGGGSARKTADKTALGIVYIDSRNDLYLEDYVNKAYGTDTKAFFDDLFRFYFKHKFRRLVVEKTVASNFIAAGLDAEMKKRRMFFEVEYVVPTRGSGDSRGNMSDGKYQRIAAMATPMKLGVIRVRKWMTELIEQLVAFPRAAHDDLADMLAYAFMLAQRRLVKRRRVDRFDDLGLGIAPRSEEKPEYEPLYPEVGL